jgi:RHH-type rel operon transcriptional repressor/antitoxin RelB
MSSPISLRLDDKVNEALEKYIIAKGISKAEFIRTAIMDKLEDDYDIMVADQAYEEWLENGKKTISFEEMMNLYG